MAVFRVMKKFGTILSLRQKYRIVELIILMVMGGVFEMASVALIMIFINAMMAPDMIIGKNYAVWICDILSIKNQETFLLVFAVFMACIYLFKNLYLLFEYNMQYHFVYENMFILQKKLLAGFIKKPYEFFFDINSGEVLRIITSDALNAFVLLSLLLNMLTEIFVSTMLVMAIFIITPVTTICITLVLFLLLFFINLCLKPVLNRAGIENQHASTEINKWVLQSIEGIKEIKIAGKQQFFQDNFNIYGMKFVNTTRKHQLLGMTPRFLIEAVSMGTFFIVVAFMIYYGKNLDSVLPVLSAVAMAAIRLLPSINRISTALAAISYHEPMLDKVISSLYEIIDNENGNMETDHDNSKTNIERMGKGEIRIENMDFKYINSESNIFTNASLVINEGESIGITGASGAGKTTIIDIILGLLNPTKGTVSVNGHNIKENMNSWHSQIGYIPQSIFLLGASIRDNIAFGLKEENMSESSIWRALQEASLDEFIRTLPNGLDTQIGERGIRLSGGQRQRIGIARALYRNPEVLVFDEATSALDNDTEAAIMESIYKLKGKRTIIIIAHRLSTIKACDHVYRVKDKKIIQVR